MSWPKRAALVVAVLLYVVVIGQNWTWYAGALMLAAIKQDAARHRAGGAH